MATAKSLKNIVFDQIRQGKMVEAFHKLKPQLEQSEQARELFLMLLRCKNNIFLLVPLADELRDGSGQGNPWMDYAYARYLDCVHPASCSIAKENYERALAAGISDARLYLAYYYRDGDLGKVDFEKYYIEVQKAIDENSHAAMQQRLRQYIFGVDYCERDIEKALGLLYNFISMASFGDTVLDPCYYYLMGNAFQEQDKDADAAEWYRKAFETGYLPACLDWAVSSYCEEGHIADPDKFIEIVNQGMDVASGSAFLYSSIFYEENMLRRMDKSMQEKFRECVKSELSLAVYLGESLGAYFLGNNYYYGLMGFRKNKTKAWKWFETGATYRDAGCYAMMAQMVKDGKCPKEFEGHLEHLQLCSLRCGNGEMLAPVVDAYFRGELENFAEEIENNYIPLLDEMYPDDEDDEGPDDDGRFDAWS